MSNIKDRIEFVLNLSLGQFQKAINDAVRTTQAMGGKITGALKATEAGFQKLTAASKAYRDKIESLDVGVDQLRNTAMLLVGIFGGAALFGTAGQQAVGFNSTIEQSQIGLAALIRTFTDVETGADGMAKSMAMAKEIQQSLQIEGLKTTATYQQLLAALQEGMGPALAAGFNSDQIVRFTSMMTQAAAAMSVPMDQLGQEIRSILEGTIDTNSRVARSLGLTNSQIKEMAGQGKLFEFLETKLRAFSQAGDDMGKTFGGAWSNVQDAIQMAIGSASEKAFSQTTKLLLRVRDAIVTVDEAAGTFKFNEKIMAAFAGVDRQISILFSSLSTEQISEMFANLVGVLGNVAQAVITFVGWLIKLGEILGPMGPVIAKYTTYLILLGGALKTLIGLPMMLIGRLAGLNAAFAAITGGSLPLFIKHVQAASTYSGIFRTALGSLGNAFTILGGLMTAAIVGWQIGSWLRKFDVVERAGIAMSAGIHKGLLRIKQAWTWITGGDTSAVTDEIAKVDKTYAQMFADVEKRSKKMGAEQKAIHKEVADAATNSADKQKKVQGAALEEMRRKYKEYGDKVKQIQDDIAKREQSLAEKLREMDRSGMSDLEAWKDRKSEAEDFATAAKKAAEESKKAFEAGDEVTGQNKAEQAVALYDKAADAAADLNREVRDGDQVIASQRQNLKTSRDMVSEYAKAAIEMQKSLATTMANAGNALDAKSGGQLSKELPEIAKQFESLKITAVKEVGEINQEIKLIDGVWTNVNKTAMNESDKSTAHQIANIKKIAKAAAEVKTTSSSGGGNAGGWKNGGLIGMMRGGLFQALAAGGSVVRNVLGGGWLPGFGGGDRRLLYGEDGEVMLNKYSVKTGGLRAALAFNAGRFDVVIAELLKRVKVNVRDLIGYKLGGMISSAPGLRPVQALANGGSVGVSRAASSDTDSMTVNLNFGGRKIIPVTTTKVGARELIAELRRAEAMSS